MKKAIFLMLMVFAFAATSALAADRPVRIAIEGNYPPFNYVDQDGQAKGFEVDLAKALCDLMGRECTFVVLDWDGMIPGLLAGKVDAVMASMSITEERRKAVAFTSKYYDESGSYVVRKGSGVEISNDGLSDARIGVQRSSTWSDYIKNTYPDSTVVYYDNDDKGCLDLLAGRIDTYLAQSYYMSQWVKKPEGAGLEIKGMPVHDTRFIGEGIGIALRKDNTELKERLDTALATILENGTYKKIASAYFDFDIYGFGM